MLTIPAVLLLALATARLCAQTHAEVLDNGLRLVVRSVDDPAAPAACWLRLEVGSAHERPGERGAAHVVEHLALTGPERGQPGHDDVAGLGLPVGQDRNAYTNLEHTAFWIVTEPGRLEAALAALATVLVPTPASPEALERERAVVLAEYEEETPETRAQRTLLAGLFPGTALDHRWPSVPPETLGALTTETVNAFRARTYTPSAATLVVVSPLEPERVLRAARDALAGLDGPAPPARYFDPDRADPPATPRTVRAESPGLAEAEITLAWAGVFRGEHSIEQALAVQVLRDRAAREARDNPDWAGSEPLAIDILLPVRDERGDARLRLVQLSAAFPPGEASRGVRLLAASVGSMATDPVTPEELDAAIHGVRSRLEKRVDLRRSLPASRLAASLASEADPHAPSPPGVLLDLLNDGAPTMRPEMVSVAARQLFDPERVAIAVQGPPGALPHSAGVLTDYRLGLARGRTLPVARVGEGSGARDVLPESGSLAPVVPEGVSIDTGSGVLSAQLPGGLLVRHRALNRGEGRVALRFTLARVPDRDDRGGAGLAVAALRALADAPDTDAPDGERLLTAARIADLEFRLDRTDDSVSLHVVTTPGDFETAARLLASALTHPRIDEADVRRALERDEAREAGARREPDRLALRTMEDLLRRPVGQALDDGGRLPAGDPARAGESLAGVLRASPGAVAVAGDIDREAALEIIARAFAGLTVARPEAAPTTGPVAPGAPVRVTAFASEPGEESALALAWPVPRDLSIGEVRQLVVAASVLARRLEDAGLKPLDRRYDLATIAYDAATPQRVALMILTEAEGDGIDRARDTALDIARGLARLGPTNEELETARARTVAGAEWSLASEFSWAARLASVALTGAPPSETARIVSDYASVTAVDCRERLEEALRAVPISVLARPASKD
ncbi:MAG: M16 family metallopeptidase [Phycisphaerales bacterium JB040]